VHTPETVTVSDAVAAACQVGEWRAGDSDGSGWLDERPIFFDDGPGSWEDYDAASLRALHHVLGWAPSDRGLAIGAMCNDSVDHSLLAQVAVAVLGTREGAIDYNGSLDIEPMGLPGWVLHLRYELAAGGYAQSAVVSAEWLAAWLADPAFRLIK
jgi:hypothetical protein